MHSPFHGFNHLAIHQSWILFPIVLVKALLPDPGWLQLLHALVLWAPALLLSRLARDRGLDDTSRLSLMLAYLTSSFIAAPLNGGFRPEAFFPLTLLLFLFAWERRSPWCFPALLLFLSVKEDASLYAAAFGAYQLTFQQGRRWGGVLVIALALTALGLDLVVGHHYAATSGAPPTFLGFWQKYGSSMPAVAWGVATHPLEATLDIAKSGIWRLYGPLALLPLLSPVAAVASLPGIVLLGTATAYPAMYDYGHYYPLVLATLAFYGLIQVGAAWPKRRRHLFATILLVSSLFNASWLKTWTADPKTRHELDKAVAALAKAPPATVCLQSTAAPHVPFAFGGAVLSPDCLAHTDGYALLVRGKSAYPLQRRDLEALFQTPKELALFFGERVALFRIADLRR